MSNDKMNIITEEWINPAITKFTLMNQHDFFLDIQKQFGAKLESFFKDNYPKDEKEQAKFLKPENRPHLEAVLKKLETAESFSSATLEKIFSKLIVETQLKLSKLAQPVRVALTGRTVSPGIYEVMEILGRERTLARLKKAIDLIPTDVAK